MTICRLLGDMMSNGIIAGDAYVLHIMRQPEYSRGDFLWSLRPLAHQVESVQWWGVNIHRPDYEWGVL